jgi:hypothetical protein
VVTLNGDDGNTCILQKLEAGERVVHRLRVDVAPVEEVARDEHEVHLVRQRVMLDHVEPAPEEVLRTLLKVIAPAAQVDVRHV